MKSNPPQKPPVPPGKQAVFVRPVFVRVWVVDQKTGYSFYKKEKVRRGYWSIRPSSTAGAKARAQGKDWMTVQGYMAELQNDYDLGGMDPIYRYHRETDMIKSLSSTISDPLHGLVWDYAFDAHHPTGKYQALRVWYIVHDMNMDRYYLYGRTAQDERVVFTSPRLAVDRVKLLEGQIMDEYEEKAYMEFTRFVGWTVYGKSKALKRHRKFRKLSKERAFDFNERRWEFRRVDSRWERGEAKKALRGVSGFHPVLRADYGGNYSKFLKAVGELTKGERRKVYQDLSWAVGQMEKALDRRRKARKPGKWRE